MNKRGYLYMAAGVSILPLWNFFCKKREQQEIRNAYGRKVTVDGYNMTVDIRGERNHPAIILLPGWGSPSPVLEFLPLAKELAKNFHVITMEPLGYGLSDRTRRPREIERIVRELHGFAQRLGCNRYYLMAHSISGIYSLYWANAYPGEVQGFIGIDCSVPGQSDEKTFPVSALMLNKAAAYLRQALNLTGITRMKSMKNHRKAVYADPSYPYSEKELEIFRILSMDCSSNRTMMNELDHMEENLEIVRNMKFPAHIPVLQFISEDNSRMLHTWETLHQNVITETGRSKVLHFGKKHYLHFERMQDMADEVREWILDN